MSLKTIREDLSVIKKLIEENKNSPNFGNNTTRFQSVLDLLVNIPLSQNISANEAYLLQNGTLWAQSVAPDSSYKITPLLYDNSVDGVTLYGNTDKELISNDGYGVETTSKTLTGDKCLTFLKSGSTIPGNILEPPVGPSDYFKRSSLKHARGTYPLVDVVYGNRDKNKSNVRNTYINGFTNNNVTPINLDPREYTVLQLPTSSLNYYIGKFPFTIKNTANGVPLASSNHIFPKKEANYDIIVYPNKIVYISGGKLDSVCSYKVFEIPSLEVIESGNDTKSNTYVKLGLTREKIVGPNVVSRIIPVTASNPIIPCSVKYGFKVHEGDIYDIFMNSIRIAEGENIRYRKKHINGEWIVTHY